MSFLSLGLSKPLLETIEKMEYSSPYPIQEQAIPIILNGKDLQARAETGSGKTASFVLPILELFQRKKISRSLHLKVLILAPTRELVMQISEVFSMFSHNLPIVPKNLAIYGGVPLNQQMKNLKHTEILVATPGRLLDMVSTNSIHLGKIEVLILDEADKMLEMGFQNEMNDILRLIPHKRQNLLFSATLDPKLDTIKSSLLREPEIIEIEPEEINMDLIKQCAYIVKSEKKGPLLRHLIVSKQLKQVLVFVSSTRTADNVVAKLSKNGIEASSLHSHKTQSARINALTNFKAGKIKVLVSTDIASRGIDIKELPIVINYELPRSPKDYLHRIGRTGRAKTFGEAISLITEEEEPHFYIIQKKMGRKIEKIDAENIDFL
ncbi:MAG: DEAD/DEAH box helicase [Leadbetterella sp.]